MDSEYNQPIEIDLKDLFCYVLKHIVAILVVAVVMGCVGASYAYVKGRGGASSTTTNVLNLEVRLPGESDDEYNNRANKVNQGYAVVQTIDALYSQVEMQNNYISNSLLMQIDPLNTATSSVQLVITLRPGTSYSVTDALYTAYENDIRFGDYLNEVADELGYDAGLLPELISVRNRNGDNYIINDSSHVIQTIDIKVYGESLDVTEAIIDSIINEVNNKSSEFNTSIVQHDITITGRQHTVGYNSSVRDSQYSAVNAINTLQSQINSENTILDNIAKQLKITDRNSFYEPSSADVTSGGRLRSSMIKYGGIGSILGILLVVGMFTVKYIFGRRFISQSQFFLTFRDLSKIGVLKPSGKRSAYIMFWDRISGDDSALSTDNNNGLIAANYKNLTSDIDRVLITGTVDTELANSAIKALKLEGDIKLNIFENPDILKTASDYDGIVLIEKRGYSNKKAVREEIRLLRNSGTKIVGSIII